MAYLINNIWLKLLALFLAIVCWFFVFGELKKILPDKNNGSLQLSEGGQFVTKKVPVQIVLEGEPADGYKVERGKILVSPNFCIVAVGKNMADNIAFIRTMPINISARSKSFNEVVKLEPISKDARQEDITVEVIVPIERISKK